MPTRKSRMGTGSTADVSVIVSLIAQEARSELMAYSFTVPDNSLVWHLPWVSKALPRGGWSSRGAPPRAGSASPQFGFIGKDVNRCAETSAYAAINTMSGPNAGRPGGINTCAVIAGRHPNNALPIGQSRIVSTSPAPVAAPPPLAEPKYSTVMPRELTIRSCREDPRIVRGSIVDTVFTQSEQEI